MSSRIRRLRNSNSWSKDCRFGESARSELHNKLIRYFKVHDPFLNRAAKFRLQSTKSLFFVMKRLISMTKPKKRGSRREKSTTKISKQHTYAITSQPKYPPHSMNALHPNAGERSTSPCRKNIRLYSRINEGRHESGVSRESKDIREPLSILTLSLALV